jgi:uncharacterized membrane protein YgdD (TMEM256/DUF423 family)
MQETSGLDAAVGAGTTAVDPIRYGLLAAGVSGAMGVSCGAFAAHGLSQLGNPQIVDWVKTGASYQLWHAAALLGVVAVANQLPPHRVRHVIGCFFWGPLVFAGSLYALAILQWHWLGAITPIGGLLMILGWVMLAMIGWRQRGGAGKGGR